MARLIERIKAQFGWSWTMWHKYGIEITRYGIEVSVGKYSGTLYWVPHYRSDV
ncbi:hypothetical protein [Rhizobium phage RHph_I40]|uniref:Uncharacterized protein n=1 Tax=Rhizobium phage RHph_I38 TaxID=2509734 RepID=A0A7S5REB4_9CAUD|nr:hypothetical protein EVC01_016 [Rhizobium phage RHph_I38]QXV73645.1 hypothetical protein [Rhizobium phage RHph_I40]